MTNTVIQLKKSATPAATPSSLANGELAINYADGILYYKAANGTILPFTSGGGGNYFGTVNANGTLVVADTTGDIFSLITGNNISIVGDAINDKITIGVKDSPTFYGDTTVSGGGKFIAGAIGGDEGGEILLEKPPNGTLDGGVTIDAYQNKLRIFEQGGSARGVYIDLSAAGAGVSTNLLASSGTTDTTARTIASSAFDKANAANSLAYNTGIGANAFTSATIAGANTAVGTGANTYADTKLANTTGTFNGTLTISNDLIVSSNINVGPTLITNTLVQTGNVTVKGGVIRAGSDASNTVIANSAVSSGIYAQRAFNLIGTDAILKVARIGSNPAYELQQWSASGNLQGYFELVAIANTFQLRDRVSGTSAVRMHVDSTGNVGIGTTAPAYKLDVNGVVNVSNGLIVSGINVIPTLVGANTAVGAGANAFTSATIAGANTDVGTGANAFTSATIAGANAAVGTGANTYLLATIAGANTAVGTGANTVGTAAFAKANAANLAAGTAYDAENVTRSIAVAAYANANSKFSSSGGTITGDVSIVGNLTLSGNTSYINVSTYVVNDPLIYLAGNNYTSDLVDIGFIANYVNATGSNVHTGLFRDSTTKEYYLFHSYDQEPVNNHIDPSGNNLTIAVLNSAIRTSNLVLAGANLLTTIAGANTAVGTGANAFTSATIAGANTAVGTGANTYLLATIAGANTTVGTGANTYLLATIAGANTAVGTGANAFATSAAAGANAYMITVQNGSNTAVGTGANAFATSAAAGANAYMITVQNGSNTAVGTGANAFTSATIAGANTAVGTGANTYLLATIAGANAAVGTGANTVGSAAFTKANNALANTTGVTFQGNLTISTSLGIGTAASGVVGEVRAANNITAYYSSDIRLKENIKNIEDGILKINLINGVEFDWKDDYIQQHGGEDGYFVRKHDVGIIAQEIERVLPEAVATRGDGIKAVRYEKIIALLIEAIKDQQKQINILEKRMNKLDT